MIGSEARPQLVPHNDCLASCIRHDRPRLLREILRCIIQEGIVVDALSSLVQLNILPKQRRPEVNVAADQESCGRIKSCKCLILTYFVQWDLLESADGNDLTVTVNLIYNCRQTIELTDTLGRDCHLIHDRLIDMDKIAHAIGLNDDTFKLTSEECLHLVKDRLAGRDQRLRECTKAHVVRSAPEELLGREL